ncbi:MAG: hypothetical protein AB7E30_06010 [Lawsonibacter sp.]
MKELFAAHQEVLDRCKAYRVPSSEIQTPYNDLWTQLGIKCVH